MLTIPTPYLVFIGDALRTKTADGVVHWRPEQCLAQLRYPGSDANLGLPDLTPAQAFEQGARTLLVGAAPAGGALPESWLETLTEALSCGLNIASGLHTRLSQVEPLARLASEQGLELFDVRHPDRNFAIGSFAFRPGKRLLTVGTDCSVGKMYTALAIERELHTRGIKADFRATGQTGILIAGAGVSVDAVIADFISAAAASLSPANDDDHWDVIEGQGGLFHPAYAGVTLGLLHGSQPDALVLCSDPTRPRLGDFEDYRRPCIDDCVTGYEAAARLTNPNARVVGISLNTSRLNDAEARRLLDEMAQAHGLPCIDPVRTGVAPIVDQIASQ